MKLRLTNVLRPPRRRLAWWIAGGTALVLAGSSGAVLFAGTDEKHSSAKTTTPVRRGAVTTTVSAAGTAQPLQSRGLNFSVAGTLTELNVKAGDTVTAGAVLARIDATAVQSAVDAAQTQVENAEEAVERAEASLSGTQSSTTTGCQAPAALRITTSPTPSPSTSSVSPSASPTRSATAPATGTTSTGGGAPTWGTQRPGQGTTGGTTGCSTTGTTTGGGGRTGTSSGDSLFSAQQQLNNARRNLQQQQTKLAGTVITAPVAGKVLSVSGVLGATAAVSSTGFIVLAGANDVSVRAQFTEAEIAELKVGQAAKITVPNLAGQEFSGTVAQIDPAGTISTKLVRYAAVIAFDKLPDTLLYGQTANVVVVTESVSDVLYVPTTATTGRNGDTAAVTVRTQAGEERRTVRIGLRGDTATEIVSGLSEGDVVLTVGR